MENTQPWHWIFRGEGNTNLVVAYTGDDESLVCFFVYCRLTSSRNTTCSVFEKLLKWASFAIAWIVDSSSARWSRSCHRWFYNMHAIIYRLEGCYNVACVFWWRSQIHRVESTGWFFARCSCCSCLKKNEKTSSYHLAVMHSCWRTSTHPFYPRCRTRKRCPLKSSRRCV